MTTTPLPVFSDAPLGTICIDGLNSSRFMLPDEKRLPYRDALGRVNIHLINASLREYIPHKDGARVGVKLLQWQRHALKSLAARPADEAETLDDIVLGDKKALDEAACKTPLINKQTPTSATAAVRPPLNEGLLTMSPAASAPLAPARPAEPPKTVASRRRLFRAPKPTDELISADRRYLCQLADQQSAKRGGGSCSRRSRPARRLRGFDDDDSEEEDDEWSEAEEAPKSEHRRGPEWRTHGCDVVGRRAARTFHGKVHHGTITRWLPADGEDCALFHMMHDDGDEEDLEEDEVDAALRAYSEHALVAKDKEADGAEDEGEDMRSSSASSSSGDRGDSDDSGDSGDSGDSSDSGSACGGSRHSSSSRAEHDSDVYEVEAVLDEDELGGKGFLIRWAGYGPEHDSWEPEGHVAPQLVDAFREARRLVRNNQGRDYKANNTRMLWCARCGTHRPADSFSSNMRRAEPAQRTCLTHFYYSRNSRSEPATAAASLASSSTVADIVGSSDAQRTPAQRKRPRDDATSLAAPPAPVKRPARAVARALSHRQATLEVQRCRLFGFGFS